MNGPGGGSVRVYLWTVRTSADDVDEVQVITTTARHGQNIRGGFFLTMDGCVVAALFFFFFSFLLKHSPARVSHALNRLLYMLLLLLLPSPLQC